MLDTTYEGAIPSLLTLDSQIKAVYHWNCSWDVSSICQCAVDTSWDSYHE